MLLLPKNEKSPLNFLGSSRDKSGDGSSPHSLSRADVGRLIGRRLPDAILHGKRSLRPRSRAVQRLATTEFRVRLFSSLGLVVAPPACKPGKDTAAKFFSASSPISAGSASDFVGTFARCHGSRLFTLRLLFVPSPAVRFLHRRCSKGFHGSCRGLVSFPVRTLLLSRLSASFVWLTFSRRPPESSVRADPQ
jgi:hypothetical protein